MTDTQPTTPRRPIVPGPSGIAAKAVAMREETRKFEEVRKLPEPVNEAPIRGLGKPLQSMSHPIVSSIGKLAGAIAGVMAQVGTIKKGGYNAFHKYNYARMEDLLEAITPLMGQNGIAVFQNEVEIKSVENRIAVTYEFTVAHASGEIMQDLRQTGMCIARNSKGDYDDKAINKCHTQARKYFLLSLFQVPTGDFEDNDPEDANQRQERRPVPGPKSELRVREIGAEVTPEKTKERASEEMLKSGQPHKITLGQGAGADQWAGAYLRAIEQAKNLAEIEAWDELNNDILQKLSDKYPEVYAMITAAVERRFAALGITPAPAMPDPKADPIEASNWVAGQLQNLKTYEAAESFWNEVVAPRENDFDPGFWDMLMNEWRRTEVRLSPPSEDEPEGG